MAKEKEPKLERKDTKQVLTGDQSGDDNFGGRTGSGTSFIAANTSRADLGAAGVGPQGDRDKPKEPEEPAIGPGGQSEIGGASDLGGGETGLGDSGAFIAGQSEEDGPENLQESEYPEAGYAEQGRGAPEGSEPGGIEGTGERTENRETDIEGSSTTR